MRLLFDQTQNNINATNEIVDEKFDTLKEEVKDLSDFTNMVNMPESCGHLKLMGDSKSKTIHSGLELWFREKKSAWRMTFTQS